MGATQNNQIRQIFKDLSTEHTGEFYTYFDLADEVSERKPSIKTSKQQLIRLSMEFNVRRMRIRDGREYVARVAFYPSNMVILDKINDAVRREVEDGFEVTQIDLAFNIHELLRKYFSDQEKEHFVEVKSLFGIYVAVDGKISDKEMFRLWKIRKE